MAVEIMVDTMTYETRPADPDDQWDRGDTGGYVRDVRARWVPEADKIHYRAEAFDVPAGVGSTVYAVVAQYESGDTFGRHGGQYQVLDVLADVESADALARAAEAVPRSQFTLRHGGKDYYVSWTGYFESLDWVRVMPLIVSA
jgi:hypothetical protein